MDDDVLYGSQIGNVGQDIADTAFASGETHLASVAKDGCICIYGRLDGQDEWKSIYRWQTQAKEPLSKVSNHIP